MQSGQAIFSAERPAGERGEGNIMAGTTTYAEAGKLSERQVQFLNQLQLVYKEYDDISGEFQIIYRFIEDIARPGDRQQVKFFPRQEGACAFLTQLSEMYKPEMYTMSCVWWYDKSTGSWVCR
jgi:hypothetical protein